MVSLLIVRFPERSSFMDAQTVGLVGFAVVALVVVFAILRYRQRSRFEIRGPGGIGATFEGEDKQSQTTSASPASSGGIVMERIKSRTGGVQAEDRSGHPVSMKDIDSNGDVRAVSGGSDPKG